MIVRISRYRIFNSQLACCDMILTWCVRPVTITPSSGRHLVFMGISLSERRPLSHRTLTFISIFLLDWLVDCGTSDVVITAFWCKESCGAFSSVDECPYQVYSRLSRCFGVL